MAKIRITIWFKNEDLKNKYVNLAKRNLESALYSTAYFPYTQQLPTINMKHLKLILTLSFLSFNLLLFGQTKKKSVGFNPENYKGTIQHTFDSLKIKLNLSWVYYKVANFDTTYYPSNQPPPPNFITNFGFSNFKLQSDNFNNVKVLEVSSKIFFKTKNDKIQSIYSHRKEKFGNGLVFSLPYSIENDKRKFIDIEVINWDYLCGTGADLCIELKE